MINWGLIGLQTLISVSWAHGFRREARSRVNDVCKQNIVNWYVIYTFRMLSNNVMSFLKIKYLFRIFLTLFLNRSVKIDHKVCLSACGFLNHNALKINKPWQ